MPDEVLKLDKLTPKEMRRILERAADQLVNMLPEDLTSVEQELLNACLETPRPVIRPGMERLLGY